MYLLPPSLSLSRYSLTQDNIIKLVSSSKTPLPLPPSLQEMLPPLGGTTALENYSNQRNKKLKKKEKSKRQEKSPHDQKKNWTYRA